MATSGIGEMSLGQAVEHLVCQRADRRNHDVATRLNRDEAQEEMAKFREGVA
jgi:hypothetical protein